MPESTGTVTYFNGVQNKAAINDAVTNAARNLRGAVAGLLATADTTMGRTVEFRRMATQIIDLRLELKKLHLS